MPSCPRLTLQEEMQSVSALPTPPEPMAVSTTSGRGQQASRNETGRGTCPKSPPKPSITKVILRVVTGKGTHHLVSLATLKSAVATVGYDMIRNAWRFKRSLQKLVDQGVLRQVTGRGALGSFSLGKKQASKPKLKAKRPRQPRRRRGQPKPGQRRPRQHRLPRRHQSRQRRPLRGSKQGHKRLLKGVRRVAKQRHN